MGIAVTTALPTHPKLRESSNGRHYAADPSARQTHAMILYKPLRHLHQEFDPQTSLTNGITNTLNS